MNFLKKILFLLALLFVPAASQAQNSGSYLVKASWYGKQFDGKLMANGKPFDMLNPHLVAHKTLPKGTLVKFTNPENGKILYATVTDRGPYVKGRAFDLSFAGARFLGFDRAGVTTLRVDIIWIAQS